MVYNDIDMNSAVESFVDLTEDLDADQDLLDEKSLEDDLVLSDADIAAIMNEDDDPDSDDECDDDECDGDNVTETCVQEALEAIDEIESGLINEDSISLDDEMTGKILQDEMDGILGDLDEMLGYNADDTLYDNGASMDDLDPGTEAASGDLETDPDSLESTSDDGDDNEEDLDTDPDKSLEYLLMESLNSL